MILNLIFIYSIGQFVLIVLILSTFLKNERQSFDFLKVKQQLKFVLPIGLSTIVSILIVKIDQLMISNLYPVDQFAIYSIGTLDIPFINIITVSTMTVLMPILVREYKSNNRDNFVVKWNESIIHIASIIYPIILFFIINSNEVITTIYTEKYAQSSPIFRIYMFRLFVKVTLFGHVIIALGKPKAILAISIITLFINLIANFIFIQLFGFHGPALATVISAFAISACQFIYISKKLEVSILRIWQWSKLLIVTSFSFMIAILSRSLKFIPMNTIVYLVMSGLIFFMGYFIFYYFYFIKKRGVLLFNRGNQK